MEIEVIIKKTLAFAGLLASVFAILILPTLIIQEYLMRAAGTSGRLIGLTISGIIIILTMRRIENFLINVTDKYLFQKKYDYKELLRTFTADVLTVLELDRLLDLTVDKLTDIIKIDSSAVLLLDEVKQVFKVMAYRSIKDSAATLPMPDVTFLEQTTSYLLLKELTEKKIFIPPSIKEIIDKLSADLLIPIVLHEEVIGILSLGKKKSDEEYTQDDLDIILPLTRTLAIAISNAKLFVELGKTQAEAAQREKMATIGTLAAGMAHEIRNPITTIRVFSEYLPDKLNENSFVSKYKDIVIKEVDRIDHIIQTMIEFSGNSVSSEAEYVAIDDAIDNLITLVSLDTDVSSRIELVKKIPVFLPKIKVNKKEFDEILLNLAQNAIHAIKDKGIIIFEVSANSDMVTVCIKDTGCGIPSDVMKNIFEPFFSTKSKGFGLGLFIVKELVVRNNGRVWVESAEGKGTTFKLEFGV